MFGLLFCAVPCGFRFAGVRFLAVGFEPRCLWASTVGCYMFYRLGLVVI